MFKKVLVAVDGSEGSQGAIQIVKSMAKNGIAESITIISVAIVPALPLEAVDIVVTDQYKMEQIAYIVADKAKKDMETEGIAVDTVVLSGDPGLSISQYANDNHFDLIIMGSRGLSGVKGLLLGSVSHKVLQTAHCPVLINR